MFAITDRRPIVKVLQIAAILNLVVGLLVSITSLYGMMDAVNNHPQNYLWNTVFLFLSMVVKALYQPFVLLGLAEIIKALQVRHPSQMDER